ncbi:MAG: 3-methyl-2-oxobutanoate hydroxymethyltransferase [Spirochaetota bacterium]
MYSADFKSKKFNINDFEARKKNGIPVTMITCYDYAFARILDNTNIDVILVGDSLGNVFAGYDTTVPVTIDQMIYHTAIVKRGAPSKLVVIDMPFMSYHISVEDTLRNAGRMIKETGAGAVKLEGGRDFYDVIKALTRASIPVMGHLGLTPQSIHKLGGFSVQGRSEEQRKRIIEDAMILEEAGVCSIVLEKVPASLGKEVSERLSIPTIGIGAGKFCDGQVLVLNDVLGIDKDFNPKFVKKYADLYSATKNALESYICEVKERAFPSAENSFE